jgi:hypothetical protein
LLKIGIRNSLGEESIIETRRVEERTRIKGG